MNLEIILGQEVAKALQSTFEITVKASDLNFSPTKKEFEGNITFVTFPFAGRLKKRPEEIGEELGKTLVESSELISKFNVVKGFLNLSIEKTFWINRLKDIFKNTSYGSLSEKNETVMVEYSSPNTNKPLHLGHLRNNFLGFSISNILESAGFNVVKANLINDRGIHICKSMLAYEKFGKGETPESSGLKGDHLVGKYYVIFDQEYKKEIESLIADGKSKDEAKAQAPLLLEAQEILRKWEANDPQVRSLWEKMNSWVYAGFEKTYKKIGVSFDKYYYESDTFLLGKDLVDEGLSSNAFFKKENNSVWADLSTDGLDEKLVLRGDGTSVYITQDMGTADLKYKDYKLDKSIYVVGNEQDYHFQVLKLILTKLDRSYAEGIYHMSYGMVDLPSGKMKSREGTVVDADDLIDEMIETAKARTNELGKIDGFTEEEAQDLYHILALGALKYFILKVDPKKRMLFNPEESIDFQGNTGPFIQYTYARIQALLRKSKELNLKLGQFENVDLSQVEEDLIIQINNFETKIEEAAKLYSPSVIAQYVYDLAKTFNRFYQDSPIFKDVDEGVMNFRVSLSKTTGETIGKAMKLLGIDVPSRM